MHVRLNDDINMNIKSGGICGICTNFKKLTDLLNGIYVCALCFSIISCNATKQTDSLLSTVVTIIIGIS